MTSWFPDEAEARPRRRGRIAVQALIYTPLALGALALVAIALVNILSGNTGYVVMLTIFGVFGLVVSYQALQYLRDLGASPVITEGEMLKKWSKGNLFFFFMPSFYIAVKGRIFTVSRAEYAGLIEEDLVRVAHYPHSLTVESLERYDEAEKKFVAAVDDGVRA